MKLFGRRTRLKLPTQEDMARRKEREAEIEAEVEKENFEKAVELALKCVEDYKRKDPFATAYCSYLVGHSLVCQHLKSVHQTGYSQEMFPKMALADYNKAKGHLEIAVEIYELFARNKKLERTRRLQAATVLIDISLLESFVENWNEAFKACKKSFEIYKEYGLPEGMRDTTRLTFVLRAKKLDDEIFRFAAELLSSNKKEQQ